MNIGQECVNNTERKNLYFKTNKLKSLYGETVVQRKSI